MDEKPSYEDLSNFCSMVCDYAIRATMYVAMAGKVMDEVDAKHFSVRRWKSEAVELTKHDAEPFLRDMAAKMRATGRI